MYDVITIGRAQLDIFVKSKEFKIVRANKFLTGAGLCQLYGGKIELDNIYTFSGGGGRMRRFLSNDAA